MATYGNGLKYSSAASSGTTVPANSFAICTYNCTSNTAAPATSGITLPATTVVTKIVAAGATIPATFTAVSSTYYSGGPLTATATYTFSSGVILTNS